MDSLAHARHMRTRMRAGELYDASDPGLLNARARARRLTARYNATDPTADRLRQRTLRKLLASVGPKVCIEPPFQCDYGRHIFIGAGTFINFGCTALDRAVIEIGSRVLMGPNVQLCAASHPTDPCLRRHGLEFARPIIVEDDVWIGAGVIVCPGVRIGAESAIGAGSIVTRDVPSGVVAFGHPCRVIRSANRASQR